MKVIAEGTAKILLPSLPESISSDMPVFYNPRMRINRDFTVLMIRYLTKVLGRCLKIADPLAGSGVRAIRILKETGGVDIVYVNDRDSKAVENIKMNFEENRISKDRYKIFQEDANIFLRREGKFDYIDIDPFGSPVGFIESAILSLKKGGMLGVTATDTAPLSGTYPDVCIRRYGAKPLKSEFYHETGIRILIYRIFSQGAQFDFSLTPVFSYSYLHHFRVFLVKEKGAKVTNRNIHENIGYIVFCYNCFYRACLKDKCSMLKCPMCGEALDYAGPLWTGSIYNNEVVNFFVKDINCINVSKETRKILNLIKEESKVSIPYFYTLSSLAKVLKKGKVPSLKRVLVEVKGVRTHFSGEGFRTRMDYRELREKFSVL